MAHNKRPLAEADTNATKGPKNAKRAKASLSKGKENAVSEFEQKKKEQLVSLLVERGLPPTGTKTSLIARLENENSERGKEEGATGSKTVAAATRDKDDAGSEATSASEERYARLRSDYHAKTNSKLRSLVKDRDRYPTTDVLKDCINVWPNGEHSTANQETPTSFTREEMIAKLSTSNTDYESCMVEELDEMIKQRRSKRSGRKAAKIDRLKRNDELHFDTGSFEETRISVMITVYECHLEDLVQKQKAAVNDNIKRKKQPQSTSLSKKIKAYEVKVNSAKLKWAHETGLAFDSPGLSSKDMSHRERASPPREVKPPERQCDYDWKQSHWADRTTRELLDICRRREMPGQGTRAAMIKWLETGTVEYEDLVAYSLEGMCRKRGLPFRGLKRSELARRLREDDMAGH